MATNERSKARGWQRRHVLKAVGGAVIAASVRSDQLETAAATGVVDLTQARIERVAGTLGYGVPAFSGDGGAARDAGLGHPQSLAITRNGDLYLAELAAGAKPQTTAAVVRRIDAGTGRIDAVVGMGQPGYRMTPSGRWERTGDPGAANARSVYLGAVTGLTTDGSDRLLIASTDPAGYGFVRRYDGASGTLTVIAGSPTGEDKKEVAALGAMLYGPIGLAVHASGMVFVADFGNNKVWRIDTSAGIMTTVAGTGATFRSSREVADPVKGRVAEFSLDDIGDGGWALDAVVFNPWGLAMDRAQNLFLTEYGGHRVRRIDATGKITTVAGMGRPGPTGDGGPATEAQLNHPKGLAVDATGNIFVADAENARIRVITPDGLITTVAGTGEAGYGGDGGPARQARLASPTDVLLTPAGDLLVADEGNRLIRRISF